MAGAAWLAAGLVAAAMWPAGSSSPWLRPPGAAARLTAGVRPYVRLEGRPVGGMTARELTALVRGMAASRDVPPVGAALDRSDGSVVAARDGRRVDLPATRRRALAAWPGARVRLVWRPWRARWRGSDLRRLTAVLGRYRTWISGSIGRRHNIALASGLIDRTVLMPEAEFSAARAIGPGTPEQGYGPAPTIQDGQMVPGIAGGVCQVTSTLYNSVLRAGLTVTERHRHGLPVHYVPRGRDATVVLPGADPPPWLPRLDFRFANRLSHPVVVRAVVEGWRLDTWIEGDPRDARPAGRAA